MIENIRVEMLGGLSVWADERPLVEKEQALSVPWQLFCYLVLNRGGGPASRTQLAQAIWPDKEAAATSKGVDEHILALQREFLDAPNSKESPVLLRKDGWECNPAVTFLVDAETFEQTVRNTGKAEEDPLSRYAGAVALYKGDLLPGLAGRPWVAPAAQYYRQLCNQALELLCGGLYASGRYNELLDVATEASRKDPLEAANHLYIFRALHALQMYRAIIPAYAKTARLFSEELGTTPPVEIVAIYEMAGERVGQIEQDVMLIREGLREACGSDAEAHGPMFCSYEVFKYLYRMASRSSERSGGSVVVVLMSLVPRYKVPAKTISAAMRRVREDILAGLLRKSDTVARYSKTQYIIMLSVEKAHNAERALERLRRHCGPPLAAKEIELLFATAGPDAAI